MTPDDIKKLREQCEKDVVADWTITHVKPEAILRLCTLALRGLEADEQINKMRDVVADSLQLLLAASKLADAVEYFRDKEGDGYGEMIEALDNYRKATGGGK